MSEEWFSEKSNKMVCYNIWDIQLHGFTARFRGWNKVCSSEVGGDYKSGTNTMRIQSNSKFFLLFESLIVLSNTPGTISYRYYNWW